MVSRLKTYFNEKFCIIKVNTSISTQPKLLRLSNNILFIAFKCIVDSALVFNFEITVLLALTVLALVEK